MKFTDSIDDNVETIGELLRAQPVGFQQQAKRAASVVVDTVDRMRRLEGNNPAVGLGVAFGLFYMAQQIVQAESRAADAGKSVIQLLS
jgi:hypothetical protein